jgi:hypothetical protein
MVRRKMAVLAVLIELVSDANSLVTGEITGASALSTAAFTLTEPISAQKSGLFEILEKN